MAVTIPEEVRLRATVGGAPLGGAWFSIVLPMRTKNPYRLIFGPASPSGGLVIRGENLLQEIGKIQDLFLMDYVDVDVGWTGRIEVRAMNRVDIGNLLLAYDTYGRVGIYPPGMVSSVTELEDILENHEGESLRVEASLSSVDESGAELIAVAQEV